MYRSSKLNAQTSRRFWFLVMLMLHLCPEAHGRFSQCFRCLLHKSCTVKKACYNKWFYMVMSVLGHVLALAAFCCFSVSVPSRQRPKTVFNLFVDTYSGRWAGPNLLIGVRARTDVLSLSLSGPRGVGYVLWVRTGSRLCDRVKCGSDKGWRLVSPSPAVEYGLNSG